MCGTTVAIGSPGFNDITPSLVVKNPVVGIDKKATVTFMGAGFEPGQEIRILLLTPDGILADIGYGLDLEVTSANDAGAWVTVWMLDRFARKKVLKEGVYTFQVTDVSYNPLANVPVAFYDPEKPVEERPSWAQ